MNALSSFFRDKKNARLVCLLLAVAGFIIDSIAFYPGFLSPDSLDQYNQALTHTYGDWHPPIMAGFWSLLLVFYNGPQPMFFFQLLWLWASFYVLLLLFIERYRYLAVLVVLFVCAPFVQNFAGNIWKDVHLALAWLLASVILIKVFYEKRKLTLAEAIISMLLICYGCWVRSNALPAVIPLAGFWLATLTNSEKNLFSFRPLFLAKALGITAIIFIVQMGIANFILKTHKNYIEYKLFAHDLTGIYYATGDVCFPDFVKQYAGFDTAYLRKNYRYNTFDNIWWNNDGKVLMPNVDADQVKQMRNAWLKSIVRHPAAYFKNKTHGFLNFLRITDSGSQLATFYPMTHPNNFGFTFTPNRLSNFFIRKIEKRSRDYYMQPWFWCILNILLFAIVFFRRLAWLRPPVLTLCLSSLIYILFEFFVFPADTEFRYFYWNCIALTLAWLLTAAEFIKSYCWRDGNRQQPLRER
jgi:hypothetical protein